MFINYVPLVYRDRFTVRPASNLAIGFLIFSLLGTLVLCSYSYFKKKDMTQNKKMTINILLAIFLICISSCLWHIFPQQAVSVFGAVHLLDRALRFITRLLKFIERLSK